MFGTRHPVAIQGVFIIGVKKAPITHFYKKIIIKNILHINKCSR